MNEADPLFVDCRNCGSLVPTGFGLSSAVYEMKVETQHRLSCPHCGSQAAYTKQEFHILPQGARSPTA